MRPVSRSRAEEGGGGGCGLGVAGASPPSGWAATGTCHRVAGVVSFIARHRETQSAVDPDAAGAEPLLDRVGSGTHQPARTLAFSASNSSWVRMPASRSSLRLGQLCVVHRRCRGRPSTGVGGSMGALGALDSCLFLRCLLLGCLCLCRLGSLGRAAFRRNVSCRTEHCGPLNILGMPCSRLLGEPLCAPRSQAPMLQPLVPKWLMGFGSQIDVAAPRTSLACRGGVEGRRYRATVMASTLLREPLSSSHRVCESWRRQHS